MPKLFGNQYTRNQIARYTGAKWQVGGVRHMRFVGGQEDNTEVVQFDTASGLQFNVLPSRGLDIASAKFCSASLCYETPAGEAHPAHFDPHGMGWLKTFYSGLVTTCGLTWAGAPCVDQGEPLGIHGRYSHLAARHLKIGDEWQGNRRRLWISGEIRESVLFGANVVMYRTISTEVGSHTVRLEDRVCNEGFSKTPFMLIYHINFGFPLLCEQTTFVARSKTVTPRDAEAEKGRKNYHRFEKPIAGYKEQLFYHDLVPDRQGFCQAALLNPAFNNQQGLGVVVRYRKKELPCFSQWKMVGAGTYVCGLEPANCKVQGRAYERQQGTLIHLNPGEEKTQIVEISVLPNRQAINLYQKTMEKQ